MAVRITRHRKANPTSKQRGIPRFLLSLAGLHLSASVYAAEPIAFGEEHVKLDAGFYRPNMETTMTIGVPNGPTTNSFNFEDTLGLESPINVFRADGFFRFTPRQRLLFGYYSINRTAQQTLTQDIQWAGQIFTVGLNVDSELDYRLVPLSYAFSFFKTKKTEAAASLGIDYIQLDAKIHATGSVLGSFLRQEDSVSGPLPVIGLRVDFGPAPKWRLGVAAQYFGISTDTFGGDLEDARVEGEYMILRNIGLGLGYNFVHMHLTADTSSWNGTADFRYNGLQAYGILRF